MGFNWTSYYGFGRVSESGPEVKNWIATDTNWQTNALLLKRFEQHHHNASTPMGYPGYNILNPATPATPLLIQSPTGGNIAAGTTVGIRLSFVDQYGLETNASPEQTVQMPAVVTRPNAMTTSGVVATPVAGALPGATYIYAITKRMNTGESALSDVLTVDVPFDQTGQTSYTVPLGFDPIGTYVDGTDSLCLYRTTGFDSNFVLLTTILATPSDGSLPGTTSSYIDAGNVQDFTHQPPQTSEFGKQNSLYIDWSSLNIPSTAYRFRIYLTQQTGVWGNSNLYQDYQIVNAATPFPTNVTYVGTEQLNTGYPLEFSQLPLGQPLVNLSTEATGAPIYTQPANAMGFPTYNFVLPNWNTNATPVPGALAFDPNSQSFKGFSAGVWAPVGVPGPYTNLVPNPSFEGPSSTNWASNIGWLLNAGATNTATPVQSYTGASSLFVLTDSSNLASEGVACCLNTTSGLTNVIAGQPYTFSTYVMTGSAGSVGKTLQLMAGAVSDNASATINLTNQWQRVSCTWTPTQNYATSNIFYGLRVFTPNTPNVAFFTDAWMITQTATAVAYADGSYGGWQWNGVANNSTSSTALYVHPTVEQGGHAASHIQFAPQVGGPTIDQIGAIIATPVGTVPGVYRKQATNIYSVLATPADLQIANAAFTPMVDMTTVQQWPSGISPSFTGQWFEITFQSDVYVPIGQPLPQQAAIGVLINGVLMSDSVIAYTATGSGTASYIEHIPMSLTYATPFTRSNNLVQIAWLANPGAVISYGGNIVGTPPRRKLTIKELF